MSDAAHYCTKVCIASSPLAKFCEFLYNNVMVLTTREMARELKVSELTLRKLAREGKIPFLRAGRDFRFELDAVKQALTEGPSGDRDANR